jgi:hypothetical protein
MLLSRKPREIYRVYAEDDLLDAEADLIEVEQDLLDLNPAEEPLAGRDLHEREPLEPSAACGLVEREAATAPLAGPDPVAAGPRARAARSRARARALTLLASALGLSAGLLVVALVHRFERRSAPSTLSSRRGGPAAALAVGSVHAPRAPRLARRARAIRTRNEALAARTPSKRAPADRAHRVPETPRQLAASPSARVEPAVAASARMPAAVQTGTPRQVQNTPAPAAPSQAQRVVSSTHPVNRTQGASSRSEAAGTAPRARQVGGEFGFER